MSQVDGTHVCVEVLLYYEEQINRELKGIHICGCRCNEGLNTNTDGSTPEM